VKKGQGLLTAKGFPGDSVTKVCRQLYIVILAIFLLAPCFSSDSHADAGPKKHILVLNSYHKGLSWTDNIMKGIEAVFSSENPDYELTFEFMDTKRHYSEKYLDLLHEAYLLKYSKEKFDLIIACDNDAFNFISKHRKDLFPNIPIVFCGINDFKDSMVWDKSRITGVVEETDVKSTLDIALRLFPETAHVVVIGDRTTTGVAIKNEVTKVMPLFTHKVSFLFVDDFDINELKQYIRTIQPDSIILLLVVNRDRTGNFFAYEESLFFIHQEAKVPIFSVWDFYLGGGIVGGMLTSGYYQGKTAGELALRIVKGEKISTVPIVRTSPNKLMFDYNQLKRYGRNVSRLPKDSVVINIPDAFFAKYKGFLFWIGVTIFSLSLIIFVLLINISRRRRIEKALRESEEKYRDLYDNAPDMYHSVDSDGTIIDCNETESKMLGYRKEEIIGKNVADFMSEESRAAHKAAFPVIKSEKKDQVLEREFVRKDGSIFPAGLHVYMETDNDNNFLKTKTIARDITESKHLENELKNSREELRNLYANLQSVREEERRSIASEIHDELGQMLTTLKLDLSWLKTKLNKERNQLAINVQSMSNLVDKTIESVQKISTDLRPGVLDHLGLSDAIEWLAGEVCNRKGIRYEIAINPEDIELDQNRSIAVFRIFQEALTNIVRHAGATDVKINLSKGKSALMLEVRDNGMGIPEEKLVDHASYGLIGIKERARYLGGEARITGVPGEGTIVDVYIPLNSEGGTDV
jgi:PAS domain S-box-containing protein